MTKQFAAFLSLFGLVLGAWVANWLSDDSAAARDTAERLRSIELSVAKIETKLDDYIDQSKTWATRTELRALEKRIDKLEEK